MLTLPLVLSATRTILCSSAFADTCDCLHQRNVREYSIKLLDTGRLFSRLTIPGIPVYVKRMTIEIDATRVAQKLGHVTIAG